MTQPISQYPDVLASEGDVCNQADWNLLAFDLGPNYGCSLSVCILCELRSAAKMAGRHWLAFDIECAICAALADEVWRANGASDRGVAMRLQGQRTTCSKWSPGF